MTTNTNSTARSQITEYIKAFLGSGMIDVELDPIHYNTAIDKAFAKYRQRSSNAVEESYAFLTITPDINEYFLSKEVIEIRQIFRRSIGSRSGGGQGGSLFEPFNLAYTNTYLMAATNIGGLATYYAFASYQNLVGKMFGSFINFTWDRVNHKLTVQQRPQSEETVLLWAYNYRPDFVLLDDPYAGIWIKDYALALSKIMLGEARELFSNIASPQGGTTLNGTAMKTEGYAMITKLEEDLGKNIDNQMPMWFVQG